MSERRCVYPDCSQFVPYGTAFAICPGHGPRTCAQKGCHVVLSHYNPSDVCAPHERDRAKAAAEKARPTRAAWARVGAVPDTVEARRIILAAVCDGATQKAAAEAVGWYKGLLADRVARDPLFRRELDDAMRVREVNQRRKRRQAGV